MDFENVKKAIKALQEGKIILVTDDEDRENEGDLICSAESATTENVNFLATYAKGLICTPMSREIIRIITRRLLRYRLITKILRPAYPQRKED